MVVNILAFLKTFIFPELFGANPPEINWHAPNDELKAQLRQTTGRPFAGIYPKGMNTRVRMSRSVGQKTEATRLMKIYGELFLKGLPDDLAKKSAIAQIAGGESQSGQMFDYGWIKSVEAGKPVWAMTATETVPAGGGEKNRKTDTIITLSAGKYRLHYKTDDSHSFDTWNAQPPDINFGG